MMERQTVWVDVARCTGCGACVNACPVGAIALIDGKARVDEETCTGCEACVDVCPEDAIQPVVRGELVSVPGHLEVRAVPDADAERVTVGEVAEGGGMMKATRSVLMGLVQGCSVLKILRAFVKRHCEEAKRTKQSPAYNMGIASPSGTARNDITGELNSPGSGRPAGHQMCSADPSIADCGCRANTYICTDGRTNPVKRGT
jgi:Fe-S-cluster-containing hydrogenase component 2